MFDLTSITLSLQPSQHGKTPRWLGRTIHSWFLDSLKLIHPDFSKALHDLSTIKPFSVSNLLGAKIHGDSFHLKPENMIRIRITSLHSNLTLVLLNRLIPWWYEHDIILHKQQFTITDIQTDSGWSGCTTFEQLLTDVDTAGQDVTLQFSAPTTFKRTGDYFDAMPYPALVFGSLLDRWNAFSPILMPDDISQQIDRGITVHHCSTNGETVYLGGRRFSRPIPTFTGRVQYHFVNEDPVIRRYLHVLAAFAKYSGVGYKTTMGLGQVRAL